MSGVRRRPHLLKDARVRRRPRLLKVNNAYPTKKRARFCTKL